MSSIPRPSPTETYVATTRRVRVVVAPRFLPDESDPDVARYVWAYFVRIENTGEETVQLLSRHWIITDGQNRVEEVRGPGVVGEQPVLKPGESFEYTSGAMRGAYRMVTAAGEAFEVEVPAFSLHLPGASRRLN